ncbi:MAG: hypothetical protein AABX53_01485 [Nanoarchaeota archaeon]
MARATEFVDRDYDRRLAEYKALREKTRVEQEKQQTNQKRD